MLAGCYVVTVFKNKVISIPFLRRSYMLLLFLLPLVKNDGCLLVFSMLLAPLFFYICLH